ncbi:MAG: hypothetical protein LBG77_07315 [Dysgonamonadaceae bacterium]|jgi:hypothetical protein|nr:hypothetical protein [Dysgonamonadaceae bacterium]
MCWQNEFTRRIKQKVKGETFTSDDIVLSMENDAIQFPKERRHLVPIIRHLKDEGWIKKDGFSDAKRQKVHQAN